jgi:hypothetical protein
MAQQSGCHVIHRLHISPPASNETTHRRHLLLAVLDKEPNKVPFVLILEFIVVLFRHSIA